MGVLAIYGAQKKAFKYNLLGFHSFTYCESEICSVHNTTDRNPFCTS